LSIPYRTRPTFDTGAHAQWALPRIVELVEANGGSALVLAATSSAGRQYASALRDASTGRWQVLSQWDGRSTSAVAAGWHADIASVLVGTRSYMSGLDAPGPTCTLVVLDRPPRSAGDPVDDARMELMIEKAGLSRWEADRRVYVGEATVLLAQSVGRLIRGATDRGMAVVLDPRLLRNNVFSYREPTHRAYMRAVEAFGTKISDLDDALQLLRTGRIDRPAA
jgi:ATP-dependent DNA helicase DinG